LWLGKIHSIANTSEGSINYGYSTPPRDSVAQLTHVKLNIYYGKKHKNSNFKICSYSFFYVKLLSTEKCFGCSQKKAFLVTIIGDGVQSGWLLYHMKEKA
jgi:hypothetical protein